MPYFQKCLFNLLKDLSFFRLELDFLFHSKSVRGAVLFLVHLFPTNFNLYYQSCLRYKTLPIVIPSIIWKYKRHNLLLYCTVLIMVAVNANGGRPAINHSRMLTKLKANLLEKFPKRPRNTKTFYPTKVQWQFLDICSYKCFLHPPSFDIVLEVNEFITEHAKNQVNVQNILNTISLPPCTSKKNLHVGSESMFSQLHLH